MPTSHVYIHNAFTDLKKERLALSKEHLNLHDRTMKTPKSNDIVLRLRCKRILFFYANKL